MIGLDLEAQGQGEEHRSEQGLAPVGIDQCSKHPGHEGDGHHLGIVPDLHDLHVVGTEGDRDGPYRRKPGIGPEGQEEQEAAEQRDNQIAGRTLAPEQQVVERSRRVTLVRH